MLTKQTKQPQRPPGVLFPPPWEPVLVLSPPRSALCLNPETGLGVRVSSLDRGGVTGPQASDSAFSYVCNFLSPLPSLLLPKAPAKKASPSLQPQHRKGGPQRGAESLGRKTQAHTLITLHMACVSPEPMWKCVCTAGLARRQNTGASRGHRLGSARLAWAWLEARVQHSLTLLAQLRQLDTLTAWA